MSGREEGQAVEEIIIEPPEIKMIRIDRTSLVPVAEPKQVDPALIRKKRNRAIRNWAILSGIETAIILLQWLAIYLMMPNVF